FLKQEQRGGFAKGAQFLSARRRERSDICAGLDWDREGLVLPGRRLRQTSGRVPGIERSSVKGNRARREGCRSTLLSQRSETRPRLRPGRRGCRTEPRVGARSQLGTCSA